MAYLLFVDESGHDGNAPYEVLAGVAVRDSHIWPLIQEIQESEVLHFGRRITPGGLELKGKKLLKAKTFRLASQCAPIDAAERPRLAAELLRDPVKNVSKRHLAAMGQAKLAFVEDVLGRCDSHGARAFASIVCRGAPRPSGRDYPRKDYTYLFERLFYFLEETRGSHTGLVVFDEIEKTQSHLLVDQLHRYFLETATGKQRASRIVPEPLFVHSELTTLVQVADIIAYVVSWGVRVGKMKQSGRSELATLAKIVKKLCYHSARRRGGYYANGFAVIDDLRPRSERPRKGRQRTKKKGNAGQSPTKPPSASVARGGASVKGPSAGGTRRKPDG